MRLKGDMASIV